MSVALLITLAIVFPVLAAIGNMLFARDANFRDALTFVLAIATFLVVLLIFDATKGSAAQEIKWITIFEGLPIGFKLEPLGMMFAIIASALWVLTHIYAVGYMRENGEANHPRFFACFSLAIAAVMGLAFASNLLTLFLFYELLTISTYPLVAHKGTPEAVRGARIYLGILISTSIGLLLTAIIWTFVLTGTLEFRLGGILEGKIAPALAPILLALYAFGIGKAALMPFHRWLPNAMVAPTPVSALLHAVAVVKAGVFTVLKVGIYIFGIDFLAGSGASEWLIWLAAYSILVASIVAMTKDNIKARLAYSTVSQLSYITLGMALATQMGAMGGALHIATHAVGKITLFMCAGAIYVVAHKTKVSELDGLGRAMPWTFGAFFIGAISIIGLPPLAGSWSKFALMLGAADAERFAIILVLMLSSILNVAYLLPIVGRGFFRGASQMPAKTKEPLLLIVPPLMTAGLCVAVFFGAGHIQNFLTPILGG